MGLFLCELTLSRAGLVRDLNDKRQQYQPINSVEDEDLGHGIEGVVSNYSAGLLQMKVTDRSYQSGEQLFEIERDTILPAPLLSLMVPTNVGTVY